MAKFERWYESNKNLNEIIQFIELLEENKQKIVGQHLLQILFNECNINLDEELDDIFKKKYLYNREYDKNYDISTCLEILKKLSKDKQDFVINRITTEILMSFVKEEI